MSIIPSMGLGVQMGEEVGTERLSEEVGLGNKWSNRRYELPGMGDLVEETGIGPTEVGLNYDLVESALEPGVATKLLCNPTDSMLPSY